MAASNYTNDDGVSSISGETLEKARRELREVPEERVEAIHELRERIERCERSPDHPGLVFERKDNKFLLRFLRARKFNLDRALQLYINYYKYRHKHAHLLSNFHPKAVEHVLRSGVFGVLDHRLKDGSKVFCLYPSRWDYEHISANDCFKAALLIMDKLLEDEETQIHGLSMFDNLEGISFSLALHFMRAEHIQRGVLVELQDSFPARFKGLHLVNQPWYVSMVMRLVKPFLKQKHRDRIHAHGNNFETIHEFLDPQHLPADFGGHLPPLEEDNNLLKLFEDELAETGSQQH